MVPQFVGNDNTFQKNTNYIGEDGLIHNHYIGKQTVTSLKNAHDDLITITTSLRKKGKRVLVLTDITRLGSLTLEARMFAVDFIKDIDFDKVAIFGNYILAEQIVNVIIMASGRGYKMKYFNSEKDAKLWLSF